MTTQVEISTWLTFGREKLAAEAELRSQKMNTMQREIELRGRVEDDERHWRKERDRHGNRESNGRTIGNDEANAGTAEQNAEETSYFQHSVLCCIYLKWLCVQLL